MVRQIGRCSFDESKCFCCSNNHRLPMTGKRVRCDRILVQELVINLFGSVGGFNMSVRSDLYLGVQQALASQTFGVPPVVVYCTMMPSTLRALELSIFAVDTEEALLFLEVTI